MSRKITLERIVRDPEDLTGAGTRQWCMELTSGHIFLRSREGGDFIMLAKEDIDVFVGDLTDIAACDENLLTTVEPNDG